MPGTVLDLRKTAVSSADGPSLQRLMQEACIKQVLPSENSAGRGEMLVSETCSNLIDKNQLLFPLLSGSKDRFLIFTDFLWLSRSKGR